MQVSRQVYVVLFLFYLNSVGCHVKFLFLYAGLLPQPPLGRPKKPYEELNTYYDEETINVRKRKAIISNKLKFLKLGPIESLRVKPERGVAG